MSHLLLNPRTGPTRLREQPVKAADNLLPHGIVRSLDQVEEDLEERVPGLLVGVVGHRVEDQGDQGGPGGHNQTWNEDRQDLRQQLLTTRTALGGWQGEGGGQQVGEEGQGQAAWGYQGKDGRNFSNSLWA